MADSPTLGSILTPEQAEAATNALQCYLDSAENVLKYRSVYVEAVETKKILVQTEIKLQEKNEVIKKLESAISVIADGGNKEVNRARLEIAEARKELEIMTEQKRKVATEMKDARQSLAKKGKEYAEMQNENSELKKAVETLAANLQNVTAAKEEAARRLGAANMQLGVYDKYTANLMDLNIAEFSRSITAVWKSADSLVKRYFSSDIPDVLFEDHDKWIQQTCIVLQLPSGSVLIPPTNSSAAKFARQVVMLSVIAAMLVRSVFTATPLRLARAGLDEILSAMMKEEPEKEALFRAMLISKYTESSMDDDIRELPQWFLDKFGTIVMPKVHTAAKKDLLQLFEEARSSWMGSRLSRQKVVATFDLKSFPNSWKSYLETRYQRDQNAEHTQDSGADEEDEVAFLAFPAIVVMRDAREETVHRGVLIYCSQLHEAEHEWRTVQKKRRFSRTGVPHAMISSPPF